MSNILNCTVKALKYNGNGSLEDGICNLEYHINNMSKYTDNLLVALNKFNDDTKEEIEYIRKFVTDRGFKFFVCTMFKDGEDGCIELAKEVLKLKKNKKKYHMYESEDKLIDKIEKVLRNEYGAGKVEYSDEAKNKLKTLKDSPLDICVSKTPMSITDNPKTLGYPKGFTMTVTDVNIYNGSGFITILMGNVITMPGLAKDSKYLGMKIDNKGKITGLK